MSRRRSVLNFLLRYTEKPRLRRETDPKKLRQTFEFNAKMLFHAPRGTRFEPGNLGIPVLWAQADGNVGPGVLLYFHGGGYIFGSPKTHRAMLARLAGLTGMRACLPRYRLAPEHPFPAAPEDAMTAYQGLLDTGVAAKDIVIGGDSAGGGLALSLLGEICARGLPKPAAAFAFSPFTDLTLCGDSFHSNAKSDVMLPVSRARETVDTYLQGADPRTPLASPIFADFTGAPDVCLYVGDTEYLLDDTVRIAARMRGQGVQVSENIAHDLPHVWPIFQRLLPEADATLKHLARWIRLRMPTSTEN